MKYRFLALVLLLVQSCGKTQSLTETTYPENVGDIAFDANLDDLNFKLCNEVRTFQYYNSPKGLPFEGEKAKLNQIYFEKFRKKNFSNETGYLTIRFVVNCKGETGRFRTQEMDNEFKAKKLNRELVSELLDVTKKLSGWIIATNGKDTFDYYQYLTFKIESGKLIEIMP
jgi:hypothetical protein